MFKSQDNLLQVLVAEDLSQVAFPAADFSIVNLPLTPEKTEALFSHLYDTPVERHVTLVVSRHKKEERLHVLGNLSRVANFKYFDSIFLWYEKASGSSNSTFTPICEGAYLFYKGDLPDVKKTAWFSEEQSNATNHWALAASAGEDRDFTYYQRFNFETALLLYSLSRPSATRRFIYGLPSVDDNLFAFCRRHQIGAYVYADSNSEAKQLVSAYETFAATASNTGVTL